MKKYFVELLGTFALTFVVGLSLVGTFPVSTPVLAALVLGLFVYTIGHVSGTHINPAVTIGALSIGKISYQDALMYIIAQVMGAFVAAIFIANFFGMPEVAVGHSWDVLIAEIVGTLFFTFGIASVVYGKTSQHLSGIVIGGSLLLGITMAALIGSNGVLNPAVAFGINSLNWLYIIAPIVGSVLGMQLYKFTASK